MRKLTEFIFFKNTPFTDFMNTILFESNNQRDDYFLNKTPFHKLTFDNIEFNFIKDRQSLRLSIPYDLFQGVNYCTFISDFEPNRRYYAFVVDYEYENDNSLRVNLLIDGLMTFCQGQTVNNFRNLKVQRKHLGKLEYENRLDELRNNDDVIKTHTKSYSHEESFEFSDYVMLIQSSCDFTVDFGDVDNPKIETSKGTTFDKMTSPLNLYVVDKKDFTDLMKTLAPYPWISQNIRSISMIPKEFFENRTTDLEMETGDFKKLKGIIGNGSTNKGFIGGLLSNVNKTKNELMGLFNLDVNEEKHLLRSEYTTTEIYSYDGQQLFIDNGCLSDNKGLLFLAEMVSGYHNEVAIYIDGYKSQNDNTVGSFLNDAIFFRTFDDVPILVDNYNLSLAKSANTRQLAESRQISNRVSTMMDSSASIQDRFYNATSVMTNFSPFGIMGKFIDEYEFYENQKAEFKDLALQTPTITSQSNNNSLAVANDFFGLEVKYSQPSKKEWEKIKRYYKMFGYQVNDENSRVDLFTNTVCNYAQFSGNYIINDCHVSILETIKTQFENGVRFWHYNDLSNPFNQNVDLNKMR